MAVGVERRAKKVASRLDHALLLQPVNNEMSLDIAGQPSGTSYSIPETTAVQSGELGSDYNLSFASSTVDPSPSHQSIKKRRPSKDKTTTPIRRSSSTPHMRNLALGNNGDLSPTDKRRNKLGYHRTSVACGHCRRRKIRCLVSQDEPTGRCANCIRLKKECNFYPVDQAPENARGLVKESSTGGHDSSTTSSPQHPPTKNEKMDEFGQPFVTTAQPGPGSRKYSMMNDIEIDPQQVPPHNTLHMSQSSFHYPHAIDTQWPPSSTFLPSSSVTESPSSSTGYWRPSPSTANSNYGSESNVSGGHTPATMSTTSTMSYGHPEPQNWAPSQQNFQPPARSMSYGNIEGLPQQFPNQGLGLQHQAQPPHDFSRRISPYPYTVSIDTNPSTIHTTLGSNTAGPLSAPIIPNHQYTYPAPWQAYNGGMTPVNDMPMSGRSMSGQWFGESGPLDQVQEEGALPVGYHLNGM